MPLSIITFSVGPRDPSEPIGDVFLCLWHICFDWHDSFLFNINDINKWLFSGLGFSAEIIRWEMPGRDNSAKKIITYMETNKIMPTETIQIKASKYPSLESVFLSSFLSESLPTKASLSEEACKLKILMIILYQLKLNDTWIVETI